MQPVVFTPYEHGIRMIWVPACSQIVIQRQSQESSALHPNTLPLRHKQQTWYSTPNCSVFVDGIRYIDSRIDSRASSDEENVTIMSISISSVAESNTNEIGTQDRPLSFFQRAARWWKNKLVSEMTEKAGAFRRKPKVCTENTHLPCVGVHELNE